MPSAKQIKARKAFAKKYAKKGKRKAKSNKPKKTKAWIEKNMAKKIAPFHRFSDPDFDAKWEKKMQEFLNEKHEKRQDRLSGE
jgi:hypothetical protein